MIAETAPATQGNFLTSLMPLLLIFGIFYFLLIRPQQKQQKKHREMLGALKKGDKVITRGGVYGTVFGITENQVTLEIADNVRIQCTRDAIATIINS
ncbi:MAG: preprotein translocase subunit YajC [Deltaproteobacteria bacterium RIFCSPLOWO2_02_FULL_44_10]|nr:MAG: preprotein translocase subunit YajC [Deltaproteobacteria bacterium RIFCSPHIGHO2_02_FULL_44_16]OGQ45474.1 MAG: preprotein translocase subunit YajC [Deltaproteobacteria bacterium RIFCSPLOWO2_02_FULL_44_10]